MPTNLGSAEKAGVYPVKVVGGCKGEHIAIVLPRISKKNIAGIHQGTFTPE